MTAPDLSRLRAGFSEEAMGSQAVFRAALQALSHPGRCVPMVHDAQIPDGAQSASAALLLALLDTETRIWLSPRLAASGAAAWLQFHTGCTRVTQPADAQFVWVALGDKLPDLADLGQGSDTYPDQSTTCVVDVEAIDAEPAIGFGWVLRGPGIASECRVQIDGLQTDFLAQWTANHTRFPRGVDVFLAAGTSLLGLPRTTRMNVIEESAPCM